MNIKRIKNIANRWRGQFLYFSPRIAIGDFLCATILRKSNSRLKHNICKDYYERAQSIICRKYGFVINNWKDENVAREFDTIRKDSPIFLFWWQGKENSPYVIQRCIDNIQKYAGAHKVIVIDKTNWMEYTSIPDYIVKNVDLGNINFTLFSDILRCCLLYDNGGIWIDPTCYLTRGFSDEIYNYSFYTIKHGDDWEFPICKGYWATFFLCSGKKNPIFGFMRDLFFEYWKREKSFIVYLSLDLFLSIAYDNFRYARNMIESVPINNTKRDLLRISLINNDGKNFKRLVKAIDSSTYINKLTYKMKIEEWAIDDE